MELLLVLVKALLHEIMNNVEERWLSSLNLVVEKDLKHHILKYDLPFALPCRFAFEHALVPSQDVQMVPLLALEQIIDEHQCFTLEVLILRHEKFYLIACQYQEVGSF